MQQLILLYNHIDLIFYLLQHKFYVSLSFYYDQFNLLKLLIIFCIGIFTSLTPCFISILPLIFSSTITVNYLNIFTRISLFLGLASSLVIVVLILYIGNGKFDQIFIHFPSVSSFIFIFIALNLLDIVNFAPVVNNINLTKFYISNIYIQSYVIGLGVGLSCLPCNSSLILTTIVWVYNSDKLIESFVYLLVYLFSCLLPFIMIFLLPSKLFKFQKFIDLWDSIVKLGGFYMLMFSSFILLQQLL